MSKNIGSTLDSLFEELGETEEVEILTHKKLLAESLRERMEARQVTKPQLATRMHTSRSQIGRLLDPADSGVTLATIAKATRALDMGFEIRTWPAGKGVAARKAVRRGSKRRRGTRSL